MHKIGLLADHHKLVKFSKSDRMYTKDVQPEIRCLVHDALDAFEHGRRPATSGAPEGLSIPHTSVPIEGGFSPHSIGSARPDSKPPKSFIQAPIRNPAARDWNKQREMNSADAASEDAKAWAVETINILRYNQDERQIDNIENSSSNTCTWILEKQSFQEWRDDMNSSILFLRGGPGLGKSVLAKYLVQKTKQDCEGNEHDEKPAKVAGDRGSIVVSFFARGAETTASDNSPKAILMHILSQICKVEPSICFNTITKSHNKFNVSRDLDFYWALFNDLRKVLTHNLYCIIDGLDECIKASKTPQQHTSDIRMEKFLARLCDITNSEKSADMVARTKILILTRPTPEIENVIFNKNICLDVQESDTKASVETFIANEVGILADQRCLSPEAQSFIIGEIVAKSGHIFQTAQTALTKLRTQSLNLENREVVMATLDRISSKKMDDAYEETLEILKAGPTEDRVRASRILKLLYFAQYPITLPELENALRVNIPAVDTVKMTRATGQKALTHFLRTKLGLLVKFGASGNIQLQHQSVKDYLQGLIPQRWPDFSCANETAGHLFMTLICLGHLLLWVDNVVSAEDIAANEDDEDLNEDFAKQSKADFYTYASCWWETHGILAKDLVKPYMPLVNKILEFENSHPVDFFLPMMRCRKRNNLNVVKTAYPGSEMTPLAFIADYNFVEVLRAHMTEIYQKEPNRLTRLLSPKRSLKTSAHWICDLDINDQSGGSLNLTALHCACRNGNYDIAQLLLQCGARGDVYDNVEQDTPFSLAIYEGHSKLARLLIEYDQDYRQPPPEKGQLYDAPTLHSACHHGMTDIVRHLLTKGDDLNGQDQDGWTPIHSAASPGHLEVVALLLESKADANIPDFNGYSAIFLAAGNDHLETVKLLESKGQVDVAAAMVASPKETALHYAARNGSVKVFEYLFTKVALNTPDETGDLPIHAAALGGNLQIFNRLLNRENTNVSNQDGKTPLHLAAGDGHLDIVQRLVAYERPFGLDIDQRCRDSSAPEGEQLLMGLTPLYLAILGGYRNVVEYLLEQHADMTVASFDGLTLLHEAAITNDEGIFQLLLDWKLDPWATDKSGFTPLHTAAEKGNLEIVDICCRISRKKADIDILTEFGDTPLLLALSNKHKKVAEFLIHEGADVNVSSRYKRSTLSMSLEIKDLDIFCRLLDAGVDIHKEDDWGETLLHEVVSQEWVDGCEELLRHGAQVNRPGAIQRDTPLMIAGYRHHTEIVKILLEHEANPYATDSFGWSIMDLDTSHKPLQELLAASGTKYTPLSEELKLAMKEEQMVLMLSELPIKKPHTPLEEAELAGRIGLTSRAYARLGDWGGWKILVNQDVEKPESGSKPTPQWACSYCHERNIEGSYWGCKGCMGRLICSECYEKHQRGPCIRGCRPEHEYLEIADKAWLDLKQDVVNEDGLTFWDWVKEEQRKYCHMHVDQNGAITEPQAEAQSPIGKKSSEDDCGSANQEATEAATMDQDKVHKESA